MLKMESGLWDHMVLQRNGRGVSDSKMTGRTDQRGPVLASVWKEGQPLRGWKNKSIGRANGGKFKAKLSGLETGGPYAIELTIGTDRLRIEDVLVGDVWILAGQSNMQGCAAIVDAARPHPQVRAFYMTDRWGKAQEPLHALWEAADPVHGMLHGPQPKNTTHGVGPGLDFAIEMQKQSNIPQGLIACAHGGTSMDQWNPALKRQGGRSLYGAMIRRVVKNGGKVAGVLWYQGESERFASRKYVHRMKKFVSAIRRDCGNATLPMVMVQIGRYVGPGRAAELWNEIQDQQRRLPELIPHLAVTPSVDLPLEDSIHIGVDGPRRLGRRMARAMRALKADKTASLPITLGQVRYKKRLPVGHLDVEIRFNNVQGNLRSDGYPLGFEVLDGSGVPVGYRTDLVGDRAIIRTTTPIAQAKNIRILYGRGHNPAVNVTDMADQAVPVFQTKAHRPRALSPFAEMVRVSDLQPSAGKLKGLAYPDDMKRLRLRPREFGNEFIDLHEAFAARAPQDVLAWLACGFYAPEAMKLAVLAGPDGPVKVWVDGKQVLHFPQGTNPAVVDRVTSAPFEIKAGEHEVLVALGSNEGKAWGTFLRLQRLDLSNRQLRGSPGNWLLPMWVG